MRPRIFRSRTEIAAKRVRKTPSKAPMLMRLEMMGAAQSGRPESRDKIQCFALIKIWSSESLKSMKKSGGRLFNQGRSECAAPRSEERRVGKEWRGGGGRGG